MGGMYDQEVKDIISKLVDEVGFKIRSAVSLVDDPEQKKMVAIAGLSISASTAAGVVDFCDGLEVNATPPIDTAIAILEMIKDASPSKAIGE